MSGYQKHSSITTNYFDNTTTQAISLHVSPAKWSGGINSSTNFVGSNSSTGLGIFIPHGSTTQKKSQTPRSRNIDIPNSKPRIRPKNSVANLTRNLSSASRSNSKKLNGSKLIVPSTPIAAPESSTLSWHTRPPRGGVSNSIPYQPHASTDETSLNRVKKPAPHRRRDSLPFSSIGSRESEIPSWDEDTERDYDVQIGLAQPPVTPVPPPINIPSAAPLSYKDGVEDLARALLSDCINKRNMEQYKLKKIKIDVLPDSTLNTDGSSHMISAYSLHCEAESKGPPSYEDAGSGLSCSSSDDELNQLYSMEPCFVWDDKCRLENCHDKQCRDVHHCQEVENFTLNNSPGSDGYFEEKGLPKEVRYNLPIAYGTVHETGKHCTICQVPYEIGSHIVTLTPCQHFFHALCVDQWLWNHVTCPLCRKEVVYESDNDVSPAATVHVRGTECPEEDQETMRRKLRSQCAEFRPVHSLADPNIDQLEIHFSSMHVMEERKQLHLDHLACPTPQRQLGK